MINSALIINCDTCLDQEMVYCTMKVEGEDQNYLGITSPQKFCSCRRLLQGTKLALGFYWAKIVEWKEGVDCAKSFLGGLWVVDKSDFGSCTKEFYEVLGRSREIELQINFEKPKWVADKRSSLRCVVATEVCNSYLKTIKGLD